MDPLQMQEQLALLCGTTNATILLTNLSMRRRTGVQLCLPNGIGRSAILLKGMTDCR